MCDVTQDTAFLAQSVLTLEGTFNWYVQCHNTTSHPLPRTPDPPLSHNSGNYGFKNFRGDRA